MTLKERRNSLTFASTRYDYGITRVIYRFWQWHHPHFPNYPSVTDVTNPSGDKWCSYMLTAYERSRWSATPNTHQYTTPAPQYHFLLYWNIHLLRSGWFYIGWSCLENVHILMHQDPEFLSNLLCRVSSRMAEEQMSSSSFKSCPISSNSKKTYQINSTPLLIFALDLLKKKKNIWCSEILGYLFSPSYYLMELADPNTIGTRLWWWLSYGVLHHFLGRKHQPQSSNT